MNAGPDADATRGGHCEDGRPSASAAVISALIVTALCALPVCAAGPHQHAHRHGHVRLDIAVERDGFSIGLEAPLDSLLGFERAPRSDQERQVVRSVAERLRSGSLFVPNPEAGCKLSAATLRSDALGDLLGNASSTGAAASISGPQADDAHADLEASFVYTCHRPTAFKSMHIGLADAFKRIQRIDVQLIAGNKQAKRTLTGTARQLSW